ncbi:MAG TPA: hypothetical protein VLH85_04520 [Levilinea sp.]|nr:hypothetical protein [Levilinea sp.]
MKTFKVLLLAGAILLVCLPLLTAQAAGRPYMEKTQIDETYPIPAGMLCAFDVVAHVEGVMTTKVWVDEEWKPSRALDHYRVRWTYSANGITLKANTGGPSHVTFLSPTEVELRYTGAYTLVAAKGRGVVFGSAGQGYEYYTLDEATGDWVMTDSTFKSGINAFWDPTAFCAALTP